MLDRAGYGVIEASGAAEAMRVLESHPYVTVLLTDCTMPGVSGEELASVVMQRWPEIKIIAMSGQPRSSELPAEAAYISKPFRLSTLVPLMRASSAIRKRAGQTYVRPLQTSTLPGAQTRQVP
jgi:DNA-binding NtrC family response regulator